GAETRANSAARFSAVRTTTAAWAGSVLIAVQGAASCRYSLPSTQRARSACAALRTSIASNWAVRSASCAATSAQSCCSRGPGSPPSGTTPSNRLSQNLQIRLTKLPSTSARSRFTDAWKISQVNEVSECSGELAVRYQRQTSAGASSSAV